MRQLFRSSGLLLAMLVSGPAFAADKIAAAGGDIEITPIVHSSVQLEYAGKVIHVDPWSLGDLSHAKPADLILVTDDPGHHLDPKAIQQLRKPGTPVVLPPSAQSKFPDGTPLAMGERGTFAGISVEAIPAYDIKPGEPWHPKGKANGYLVTLGGKRVYLAGVTECVAEIRALKNIDVAFLPMNLPLDRMAPSATAECAAAIKPKVVYLYHYNNEFASRLTNPNAPQSPGGHDRTAASLQALKDALRGEPIEVRMGNWYPATLGK
jgi:L-ascorbate metabolism protein UlaG (beta-lactamase superfamily)